jgi:hypothetical protein
MPCPVCRHPMQNLGLSQPDARLFWCPRCGTLKTEVTLRVPDRKGGVEGRLWEDWDTPKLIRREDIDVALEGAA